MGWIVPFSGGKDSTATIIDWNNEPFCGDKNCDVVKYWNQLTQAPKDEK